MTSVQTLLKQQQNTSKSFVTEEVELDSPDEEMDEDSDDKNKSDSDENSGAEGDESAEDSEDADKSKGNAGWADAMAKILRTNKPKRKKTIVLSKAKKLNEIVSKPKEEVVPFEIEQQNGEANQEKKASESSEVTSQQKKNKKKDSLGVRIKPWEKTDREHERHLKKIATAGVVQLFNAVRQQQKEIEDKLVQAGPLERKREKALKSIDRKAFLDVLMGGTSKLTPNEDTEEFKEEDDEDDTLHNGRKKDDKVWSVLRDDFAMGAKLKDWDKQNSEGDDSSAPEEMDSD